MIRATVLQDLPDCLAMGQEFWSQTRYPEPYDADHVQKMMIACMGQGLHLVLELEDNVEGFIMGLGVPLLGNGQTFHVTELAFWLNPKARGAGQSRELLRAFEEAAEAFGAVYVNMIAMESLDPEIAERIYEDMGYTPNESTWTKRVRAE